MQSVTRHLPDFSTPAKKTVDPFFKTSVKPVGAVASPALEALVSRPAEPKPVAVDIAQVTRDAEARGHAAGEAAASAVFERKLRELEQAFEERLKVERDTWTREQADVLATALQAGTAELEVQLKAAIAPLLLPFLKAGVAQRALDELETLIVPMLDREDRPVLKITGPHDLVDRLRDRLGDPPACIFEAGDTADVRVVAGETVLETQVSAWIERLIQAES